MATLLPRVESAARSPLTAGRRPVDTVESAVRELVRRRGLDPLTDLAAVTDSPILDRNGLPIHRPQRSRVLLPVCESCNGGLNTRFEVSAKEVVTALALSGWAGTHTADEWRAVGMWWAKVILILGHPRARIGDARLDRQARIALDGRLPDIKWMSDGTGPPDRLSVFVHNTDLAVAAAVHKLAVPAVVYNDDGTPSGCHVLSLLSVAVVFTLESLLITRWSVTARRGGCFALRHRTATCPCYLLASHRHVAGPERRAPAGSREREGRPGRVRPRPFLHHPHRGPGLVLGSETPCCAEVRSSASKASAALMPLRAMSMLGAWWNVRPASCRSNRLLGATLSSAVSDGICPSLCTRSPRAVRRSSKARAAVTSRLVAVAR